MPDALRRSIPWDQGKEIAQHAQFSVATGVPVYFSDTHVLWQRSGNENTNSLLRQYFPNGISVRRHIAAGLGAVADRLNNCPRKALDWQRSIEKLDQLLLQ